MKEMPGYVRAFYRELEAGRLPGMRCPHCGQVRLTYVPVCDRCKRRAPEPVELEKRGVLTVFSGTWSGATFATCPDVWPWAWLSSRMAPRYGAAWTGWT